MVHGTAAGGAAHHMDLMGLHKGPVDLTLGVLVLPDDDGVVVLPQEQILPRPPAAEYRLFKRQIVKRVLGSGLQIVNLLTHSRLLCKKCRMFFLIVYRPGGPGNVQNHRKCPPSFRCPDAGAPVAESDTAVRVRPRAAVRGTHFYQMALVSTSCFSRAAKSATDMAPRSSPVRRRTETVWFSISRSPTTSI